MDTARQRSIIAEFLDAFPAVLGHRFWPRFRRVVGLIFLLAVTRSMIADCNVVPSGSMIPTLVAGDCVLVNKLAYDLRLPFANISLLRWSMPMRGDVVVFCSPTSDLRLVKRVIGLPGDVVELRDNSLYLNGRVARYEPADPPALSRSDIPDPSKSKVLLETAPASGFAAHYIMETPGAIARRSFAPVTVPAGKYFMMGDNRDDSLDSRYIGLIDRSQIIGRASRVVFSLGADYLPRMNRTLKKID